MKQSLRWKTWAAWAAIVLLAAGAAVMLAQTVRLNNEAMVELNATDTPEPPYGNVMVVTPDPDRPTAAPVLRTGSQGDEVVRLQTRLQELGYYSGEVDGRYGAQTNAAVVFFQEVSGLEADGMAGELTQRLLYSDEAPAAPETATPAPAATPTPAPVETAASGPDFDAVPLLVNREHPIPDGYQPVELVNLSQYCDSGILKAKANGIEGERAAVDALQTMLASAVAEGISPWQVNAGYRSVKYQRQLFDRKVAEFEKQGFSHSRAVSATRNTVADPGTSEHHTGLAFDMAVPGVSFKGTRQAKWLAEHCWEYGFILRYTEEKQKITGYLAEPWHIRYVGEKHALIMRDENLCLEEYVDRYDAL